MCFFDEEEGDFDLDLLDLLRDDDPRSSELELRLRPRPRPLRRFRSLERDRDRDREELELLSLRLLLDDFLLPDRREERRDELRLSPPSLPPSSSVSAAARPPPLGVRSGVSAAGCVFPEEALSNFFRYCSTCSEMVHPGRVCCLPDSSSSW